MSLAEVIETPVEPKRLGNPKWIKGHKPPKRENYKQPKTRKQQMLDVQRLIYKDIKNRKTPASLRVDLVRSWLAIQEELRQFDRRSVPGVSPAVPAPPKTSAFVPPDENTEQGSVEPDNPDV